MNSPELKRAALAIAVAAPKRQNKNAMEAKVPWGLIHALRDALEAEGYDLEAAREANYTAGLKGWALFGKQEPK